MAEHKVVSKDEWLKARLAHLEKEKAFDRQRDALAKELRELPWVKIDKEYDFDSTSGKVSLADLFGSASQLIVYHFMLHESWESGGCPACSYLADHFDGMQVHLRQRDVTFVAVSNATVEKTEAYRKRMGWNFKWVSSYGTDFNTDYHVSFTEKETEDGFYYNYRDGVRFPSIEGPGASVFYKDENGDVYHTYSTYARGLDRLIGTYHYLDMTPKGRDEEKLDFPMAWIRRHDEYES